MVVVCNLGLCVGGRCNRRRLALANRLGRLGQALEVKLVGVPFAVHLLHNILVVIVAQRPTKLVVVHVWFALAFAPFSGNFIGVDQFEFSISTVPSDTANVCLVRQKLEQKLPQLYLARAAAATAAYTTAGANSCSQVMVMMMMVTVVIVVVMVVATRTSTGAACASCRAGTAASLVDAVMNAVVVRVAVVAEARAARVGGPLRVARRRDELVRRTDDGGRRERRGVVMRRVMVVARGGRCRCCGRSCSRRRGCTCRLLAVLTVVVVVVVVVVAKQGRIRVVVVMLVAYCCHARGEQER